jgi:hypothetical protein
MTTSWGAQEDRSRGRWQAPRIAYELAAAYVEEPVARGGGGGPSFPEPARKRWADLGPQDRRDVTVALAAQARLAIGELERVRPGHGNLAGLRLALARAGRCRLGCTACAVALCRVEIEAWLDAGFAQERIAAALAAAAGPERAAR